MNMEMLVLKENEDGSADVELRIDQEGKEYLINLGFNALLMKAIDHYKLDELEECKETDNG